jgi:hypothetical protein
MAKKAARNDPDSAPNNIDSCQDCVILERHGFFLQPHQAQTTAKG